MSGITLSASVRQNLLSLQSTADLLATTQSRLSTGKKVNSALDNPTNFFTAQGLENRAGDINNLLDSIGNGVQILQAANTGLTSLQKLVDSAKSIANQVLQTPSGYSTKSQFTVSLTTDATATNLLGAPAKNASASASNALSTIDASGTAVKFDVNGQTVTLATNGGSGGDGKYSATDIVAAINTQVGTSAKVNATLVDGKLTITSTDTAGASDEVKIDNTSDVAILGFTAGASYTANGVDASSTLSGKTLTIDATDGGTATNIVFGAGGVSTLDDLNKALASNNLTATLAAGGQLTISTTNDHASATMNTVGGTAFASVTQPVAPTQDNNSQNTRTSLIAQYNQVIDQIKTTAADSSFNGVNLLNGDQLKMVFNETGKSTLTIQGVTFDPAGLGLSSLKAGTDFLDNSSANKVLDTLNNASSAIRSQASALGSNLSVVQIRQDFNKNLINVLQTGSSNLTLADTNEEAANSQALSTRQSIAVSALSLANQSQQSVLQLLR